MSENLGFKISLSREDLPPDSARLFFRGRFCLPLTERLQGELERLMQAGILHLKVDLAELHYLDSTGLGAFVTAHKALTRAGGSLELENPRKLIHHIFTSAHLDKELNIGKAV